MSFLKAGWKVGFVGLRVVPASKVAGELASIVQVGPILMPGRCAS